MVRRQFWDGPKVQCLATRNFGVRQQGLDPRSRAPTSYDSLRVIHRPLSVERSGSVAKRFARPTEQGWNKAQNSMLLPPLLAGGWVDETRQFLA